MLVRQTVFSLLFFCSLLTGLEVYGHEVYPFTGGGNGGYERFDDGDDSGWSARSDWQPERGDIIVEVNGVPVRNKAEYARAVKESPETITLTVLERDGTLCQLRTKLWPSGYGTRLGIYIETAPHGGAVVTGLVPGSPAYCFRYRVVGSGGDGGDERFDDGDDSGWSARSDWQPERGDIIIEVNGVPVRNKAEYARAVKESPETITLTVLERDGTLSQLRTKLWPSGHGTRLGIYIETAPQGGAVVTGLVPGSPAYRFRYRVVGSANISPYAIATGTGSGGNIIGGHSHILIDTETNEYTGPYYW